MINDFLSFVGLSDLAVSDGTLLLVGLFLFGLLCTNFLRILFVLLERGLK